jgi:hypothetical protein
LQVLPDSLEDIKKTLNWFEQLTASSINELFFEAKPEKIPDPENELRRNLFKLHLEAGIIIEDESLDFFMK